MRSMVACSAAMLDRRILLYSSAERTTATSRFWRATLASCYTVFVSEKSQLRNVTVTLEEDVAQWARIEAARRDTSVSRLLGELLKERMTAQDGYAGAMRRALGRKPFLRSTGRYLTREEAHDRSRLR